MADVIAAECTPEAFHDLLGEFGRDVFYLLDDCETRDGQYPEDAPEIHLIPTDGLQKVSKLLDRIEALPFSQPYVISGPGHKLQLAFNAMMAIAQVDKEAMRTAILAEFDKAIGHAEVVAGSPTMATVASWLRGMKVSILALLDAPAEPFDPSALDDITHDEHGNLYPDELDD
ncbi:MAG: hypothetical protein DI533_04535 [Cereibacter sphaeroides]|uniref:Uncharacterized protein n=1 Tax=Cereibacter sphaeroides TaxID=1063 RepID=A0A2W5U993_CERSP|nr:MAG: hypothetical protein DI533_04535 [Cereibacter sphaeroides]